jgi:predicted O-methyltransferase YrrM
MSGSETRFHTDEAHLRRARGALPFPPSDQLGAMIREEYAAGLQRPRPASDNPFALLPDTLSFLHEHLERARPQLIVEFGSGASTRLFAAWASVHQARLISVEHDRRWVEEVARSLSAPERAAVELRHAALRLTRRRLRQFLSYRDLDDLAPSIARADLILLDGPHISGRELVLRAVLAATSPGAIIVVDDFRHYAVREMLMQTPAEVALCFEGEAIDENSHGLYVLRCVRHSPGVAFPPASLRTIGQSYWRCLRDFREHGTGD